MHIPDGYLSPSTCVTMGGVMLPIWYRASAVIKKKLDVARIPFMAMGAVFSFLLMMFNIPIPDGTTAHAVGGVLLAVVLGPWTAVIAISVALFIQALVFGDGGILAFGANAFTMAFAMPFAGYYTFRLIARRTELGSGRYLFAAGIGGYVGVNTAAFFVAVLFGIQSILFTAPDGTPLYCPYGLDVAIPAMMTVHLTVVGIVEGMVTAVALRYIIKNSPEVVESYSNLHGKG
jgi:cobalt/nickel transport system permease protein